VNRSSAFGRYEILDRISAGGMAEVFRAKDTKRGSLVALKKLLPQVAEDEEFIEMFEDEARIVSQLEHPHIARNLDYGRVDGAYFIAFEFVHGRDLRKVYDLCVRQQRRLPIPFLIYVFARIGEGLAYAHARKDGLSNLVHRDVSPQNIVVSFEGDVKLIDFGIARAAGKLSRTQAGTIKGKFGYMSPEQVRGEDIDQRTDVFSLGICLWEMLTLKRLFQAENELLVLEKIRNQPIEPPSRHNPEVPPELDRIVLKALAKNLDERYRSAKEFYRDLNAFAQSAGASATREDIARTMRSLFPDASSIEVTSSGIRVGSPPQPGAYPVAGSPRSQETSTMASDNKGSDLDIFEGLGKKSAAQPSVAVGPRAAPVAPSRPPAPPGDPGKKTLLGIASPANPPPPVVPPPRQGGAPAQPTSNRGMPAVIPPKASPAPAPTRPAPYTAGGGGMDMDWDDDDEATHIFDKDEKDAPPAAASPVSARPAAGAAPPPPPPGGPTPLSRPPNQGPPPPPPGTVPGGFGAPPPAPSSVGASLARASGTSAAPGPMPPPTINPMMGPTMPLAPPPPPPGGPIPSAAPAALPPRPPSVPPPAMQPPVGMQPAMQPMGVQMQPPMGMQPGMQPPPMGMQPGVQPGPVGLAPGMAPQPGVPQPGMMPPTQVPGAPTMPPQHVATAQDARRLEATQLVRPAGGGGGKIALMLAAVVVLLAVAGGAAALFLLPKTGRILVNATDSKGAAVSRAEVFVDGKKQCDVLPCTVDAVPAGPHDLKILAEGYDPASQTVTVESKKDANVDVKLSGGAAKGTGLRASSTQPGVKLYVDGEEIGPLPQELRTLSPGDHKLKFVGSDRYAPLEKTITVVKDEVQDIGSVTLKVVKGKATIALGTPGARVTLVSGTDRRDLPTFPISVDIDTSKTWTLEATKFGFQDYKQPISFDDGVAEKMFTVTLEPKGAAAPPVTFTPPPPTTAPPPVTVKPPTTAAPATGEATVTLNSVPPSKVVLDGKPLGDTPQKDIKVSAGDHKVTFINSEQDLKKTVPFTVKAGETKVIIGKLRE
jgi:serine/threonine-protein kinase